LRFETVSVGHDAEAASTLLAIVTCLALPTSFILLIVMWLIDSLLSSVDAAILDAIAASPLMSEDPEWFRLQFFLWPIFMFAVSYWQWFVALPKVIAHIRHRRTHK